MTTPVRVLVCGHTPGADRVAAVLRDAGMEPTIAAGSDAIGSAIGGAAWDVAVDVQARSGVADAAQRTLSRAIDAAGKDTPLLVVLPSTDKARAGDLMRAGACDCITDDQLSRLVPAIERELAAATVRSERRTLEVQLRHAHRMEAVGRLASGIAHDFSNLLTAVTGHTELLIDLIGPQDPLRRTAEEIRGAALRAAALTSSLLTFSRRQEPGAGVLDINALLADMERMLRRLIGEHIELTVALAPGESRVVADRGQLEQVIMNLVFNARDAMPHGGRLSLGTAHVKVKAADRAAAGAVPGPYVALEVRDTGLGMSDETQAQLFQPFFTTKAATKGTGLGLSMVEAVVRETGGVLTVQSRLGEGTTFRILLPRATDPVTRPAARRGLESLPRGTETVLLVEDEVGVRDLVRDLLMRCGYTVIAASDVSDAIALFARHRDEVRLLVTDMVMPKMNGRQLAERFVSERPALRVLYMSGYTDHQVLTESGTAVSGFLQKPFTPDVLARKVRELLDGTPPAS